MGKATRSYYIDNLRILLTALVVMHHWAITYGAPGLWYYNEGNTSEIASIFLALFVATNQAFFMGMFFMISSYFLDKSWRRKTKATLLKDKFKRLGIPLLIYIFILSPIIIYLSRTFIQGLNYPSVPAFLTQAKWLTFGPLWFVAALLIFSLVAILFKSSKVTTPELVYPLPNNIKILGFAVFIALISFFVRIGYPVGKSLQPIGFQLAHFAQYISLFYIGIIASRHQWFDQVTYSLGIKWFKIILLMIFVLFPLGFYLGGALEGGTDVFMGGWSWQSLFYCLWEQIVGIGIMVSLLGIFKEKYNRQGEQLKKASASAYSVYIIHALILVSVSILIKDLPLSSTFKFIAFAPVVLLVSFGLGNMLRKLPLLREVL